MADERKTTKSAEMRRRDALAKLGLGILAAYSAPTVLHIDRSANAVILPTPCHHPGQGVGPNKCPPGHQKPPGPPHQGHS